MRARATEVLSGLPQPVAGDVSAADRTGSPAEARGASGGVAPEPADADLVAAACAGDPTAFEALVARHMRRAFAVAYRVLGQRQDAEDVVQDGFVAALAKIETFDRSRPFAPWLLRIVANRAINARRARALRQAEPIPPDVTSGSASPLDAAERGELRARLEHALAQLPDQKRWIVELFEIDGFTGPEIAVMLQMAEGTVRWHLHQARHTLRAALGTVASRRP
jgi:RNA polymerase sigma-70 factor, ECF subfamily